jgi:pilus assembly protein FimV
MALGLGEIRVLSRPGQPLLAEIPIVSNAPGELEAARARLASADTFARVGLAPPDDIVKNLQFQITQNAQGQAVIRVTGSAPVNTDAVGFLIDVEWGQGRLVREYSALLSAPQTAAAINQPVIQGPSTGAGDNVVRPATAPAAADDDWGNTAASGSRTPPTPPTPPVPPPARPQAQTPAAVTPPPTRTSSASPPAHATAADGSMTVQRGQTLSQIAAENRVSGYTLNQTMMALLRVNPDAFIGGNINLVRAGARLRMPSDAQLAELNAAVASAQVREQIAQWRQGRSSGTVSGVPAVARTGAPAASASAESRPGGADARLEIAPAAAATTGKEAGVASGTGSGSGGGNMLSNDQVRQAQEDLAAREGEVHELRSRVAELEKLQEQSQQLLTVKDSELAAAQERLRQTNASGSLPMWVWGVGAGLILLALLLLLLLARRRKPSPLSTVVAAGSVGPEGPADPASMVAGAEDLGMELETLPEEQAPSFNDEDLNKRYEDVQSYADELVRARRIADLEDQPQPQIQVQAPPPLSQFGSSMSSATEDRASLASLLRHTPDSRDRLELALAYIDLGDTETARDLLNEVVKGDDAQAREEAKRHLQELGG